LNKSLPYLIAAVALVLLLILATQGKKHPHVFDERFTFSRKDKIPYGCYVAYSTLPALFPGAKMHVNAYAPAKWDSIDDYASDQALVIVSGNFAPDEYEMYHLRRFVEKGNTIFISAAVFSAYARDEFKISVVDPYELLISLAIKGKHDSFVVSLKVPPFLHANDYALSGNIFESYFTKWDYTTSTVLGDGINLNPNFIRVKAGKGNFFLHLNPLAFSNYFILHKYNNEYFGQVMSVIPKETKNIFWDEYFQRKRSRDNGESGGTLSGMMKHPSFRTAFWVLLLLLFLYVLQEMRRKQRYIPELARPRNDSLNFVKTIGRLYYEKKDHVNLARKMSAYFLEHVRNKYKLPTSQLDEKFAGQLHFKTGYPLAELQKIVSSIKKIDEAGAISDQQLGIFHKQLEAFYTSS
jgi:hypothetical protein